MATINETWQNVEMTFHVDERSEWERIITATIMFSMCAAIGVWCIYAIRKVEGEKSSTYHLEKEFMPDDEKSSKRSKAGTEFSMIEVEEIDENDEPRSLREYLRKMAQSVIPSL